jgi:hypothetical protein
VRINAIIRRADEAASRREQQQHARAGNFSLSLSLFAYPMWNIQSMKCEGLNSRISGIPCRKRLSASDRSGTLDSSTGGRQSKGPETHCRSTVIALVRQRHVCVIDRYSWYGQHCWITHSLTDRSLLTQFGSLGGLSGRILSKQTAVNADRKNALRVGRTYGSATERASASGCRTAKACLRIRRAAALPPKCSRPCSSSCRRLTTPMLDRRSAHTHTHQSVSTCRAITTPT